jgi:hypothetical protein
MFCNSILLNQQQQQQQQKQQQQQQQQQQQSELNVLQYVSAILGARSIEQLNE